MLPFVIILNFNIFITNNFFITLSLTKLYIYNIIYKKIKLNINMEEK